ncbi:MAG TPA: hypothetical protein VJA21_29995 [Verrucomicrobiae bacterium]
MELKLITSPALNRFLPKTLAGSSIAAMFRTFPLIPERFTARAEGSSRIGSNPAHSETHVGREVRSGRQPRATEEQYKQYHAALMGGEQSDSRHVQVCAGFTQSRAGHARKKG